MPINIIKKKKDLDAIVSLGMDSKDAINDVFRAWIRVRLLVAE